MRFFAFLASLAVMTSAVADVQPIEKWKVLKDAPFFSFSAEFSIKNGKDTVAHITRAGRFCPRYYYDLFDANDQFLARGITRAFSLGLVYAWGTEIDVYDADVLIGTIQGNIFSRERAKFSFLSPSGLEIAAAHLNKKSANLMILAADDASDVVGELKGNVYGDTSSWEFDVFNNKVDDRLLKVFAAFVADYDVHFMAPPKTVNHYHYHDKSK